MSNYPNIMRACQLIALDNGGINRFRSAEKQEREFTKWLSKQDYPTLSEIEAWLETLTDGQIYDGVCGGEGEPEQVAVMSSAPPFTDDLLNAYFEEVC